LLERKIFSKEDKPCRTEVENADSVHYLQNDNGMPNNGRSASAAALVWHSPAVSPLKDGSGKGSRYYDSI
jgi:hypothetical protein